MGMSPQQQPQQPPQQQGMMTAGAMMYNGFPPYSGKDHTWDVQLNAFFLAADLFSFESKLCTRIHLDPCSSTLHVFCCISRVWCERWGVK